MANLRNIRLFAWMVSAVALMGCAQAPTVVERPVPVTADAYRDAFEASVASLREHGFLVDRQDYRFGRITTKPRVSPNMLEIWNRDNSTAQQTISASVNNEHRVAMVRLDRLSGADGQAAHSAYGLNVEVIVERATDPNRRLTGSTSPVNIVRRFSQTPHEFERQGVHGQATVFVERDEHFEHRLLADIQSRLAARAQAAAQ